MSSFIHNTFTYDESKEVPTGGLIVELVHGTELNYKRELVSFTGAVYTHGERYYVVFQVSNNHIWYNLDNMPKVVHSMIISKYKPELYDNHVLKTMPYINTNEYMYEIDGYVNQAEAYGVLKAIYNMSVQANQMEIFQQKDLLNADSENAKTLKKHIDTATFNYISKIEKERDTWKTIAESLLKNIKTIQDDLHKGIDGLDNLYKLFTNPL